MLWVNHTGLRIVHDVNSESYVAHVHHVVGEEGAVIVVHHVAIVSVVLLVVDLMQIPSKQLRVIIGQADFVEMEIEMVLRREHSR